MPEVTNPETIKMLNALAGKQGGASKPQDAGGGEVFIAAPGAAARETRDVRSAELAEATAGVTLQGGERAAREEVRGTAKDLRDAFEKQKVVTDYQTALPAYTSILDLASKPANKAADFTIITMFNKVQDPGSAVLEGERNAAANVSTLFEKYKQQLQGMFDPETGFVSDDARRQFVASVHTLISERKRAYDAMRGRYSEIAEQPEYGVRPELVVGRHFGEQFYPEIVDRWGKVFPDAGKAQAGQAAAPTLQVATGKTFSTDQDIAIAGQLNQLWAGGATIDQMNAKSVELTGSPLSPDSVAYLQANTANRSLPAVSPASSGGREAPAGGLMGEARDIGVGLAGGALRGGTANMAEELVNFIDPATAAKLQAALEYGQEQAPVSAFMGELAGGIASPLSRLGGAVSNPIAREAVSGALYGGLYGAGEAAPDASLSERMAGAALGGLTGGAVGGLAGRVASGMGAGAPGAQVQAARDLNIPVLSSDVAPPATFTGRGMQAAGERIPFAGTGGVRETQQKARTDAVVELLGDYGVGDTALAEKVAGSLSQTRNAEINKYTQMKREVIAPLASAGDVPIPNATKAIDEEIARLERISPEGFAPAISIMRRWKTDLAGKTLDDIEVLRRQVGEEFAAPELAAVSGEAQKSLNRIYGPLREDMGQFIKDNGARKDYVKWQVANKRLSEGADELKKTALKTALRNAEQTPESVWSLLFSSKPSDVSALYRNLGPQGRASARAAIIDKVFRDGGGQLDQVTPEKFLRDVRKQSNQVRIFFSGEEAKRLEGLIGALKLTARAGESPVVTQSGVQTYLPIGVATLADVFGTGGAAMAGGTGIGLMARAYESGPVRNAIMRFQSAKPIDQNKAAQNVLTALRTAFAQAGGNAATEPQASNPEPKP